MIEPKLEIVVDPKLSKHKDFIERVTTEAIAPLPKLDVTVFFYRTGVEIDFFTPYLDSEKVDPALFDQWIQETTPFSYGYEDQEFLFIVIETEDYFLFTEDPDEEALKGLLMHEYMHTIQRQRGFEDDLRQSLTFPLHIFEEMASQMRIFKKEEAIAALRQIAQTAVLVLKDLYVNYELEMLDLGDPLLSYYYRLFEVDKSCPLPGFDVKYEVGKPIKDLDEFVRVIQFILGLMPSWIPLMRNPRVMALKDHISECFEISVKNLARELHHLEDQFLTRFDFTTEFHQTYFSLVFVLVFELLEGKSFVLMQLSRATDILDQLLPQDHPNRGMILTPILKAAHTYSQHPENLPRTEFATRRKLIKMMRTEIPQQELEEWAEFFAEFTPKELLRLPIFLACRMLRKSLLNGKIGGKSAQVVLILLRVTMVLDPENEILREIKRYVRRLLFTRDKGRLTICKLILPAEALAESLVQPEILKLNPAHAEALASRLALYRVPLTNPVISTCLEIMRLIKSTKEENLEPTAIALAISSTALHGKSEVLPFAYPIVRSALLALDLPYQFVRQVASNIIVEIESETHKEE